MFDWLLEFYIVGTYEIMSEQIPPCDGAHPRRPYSVATLGDHVTSTMSRFPTQSRYFDTELINPFHNLVMLSVRLGSDRSFVVVKQRIDLAGNRASYLSRLKSALYRFG